MVVENAFQRRNADHIAFLVFVVLWSSLLIFPGTLSSGYHYQDDHEIIRINNDLQSESFYMVCKKWINEDLNIRLRPFYYFHRIVITKLFGINFLALSLYTGFLGIITLTSLFFAMKNLKFNTLETIGFLIIALIGPQLSIWWRLGPNETIGITLMSLGFWSMSKCLTSRHYILYNILFVILIILSSLCKESFLIIVPGFIVFKILNEKEKFKLSIKKAIWNNMILLVPVVVVVLELLVIVLFVGTNRIGYAGIDSNLSKTFAESIKIFKDLWKPYFYLLSYTFIILIIAQLVSLKQLKIRQLVLPFVFSILIVIPNFILYAKSGIWERYLIPSSFGFAFLLASILKAYSNNFKVLKIILFVFIIITYFPIYKSAFISSKSFAREGTMLKSLISNTVLHNREGTKVLIVVDPVKYYEQSYSIKIYLQYECKINLYGYAVENEYNDEFSKGLIRGWYSYFQTMQFDSVDNKPAEIIFLDKSLMNRFFTLTELEGTDYIEVLEDDLTCALLIERDTGINKSDQSK